MVAKEKRQGGIDWKFGVVDTNIICRMDNNKVLLAAQRGWTIFNIHDKP